jgi:hypothetical protein
MGCSCGHHTPRTTDVTRFLAPRAAHADRTAVCYRARMSWILPTPLLLFAGVVALLPLAALLRRSTSAPHLVAEAFVTALGSARSYGWRGRALWLIEQR